MASDLHVVDDYLSKWVRFAQGESELVTFLRDNKGLFEAALTRMLNAKDKRAPARMVFCCVVQVGGAIPADTELGKAAASILGPDFPATISEKGERIYFCGDLRSGGSTVHLARRPPFSPAISSIEDVGDDVVVADAGLDGELLLLAGLRQAIHGFDGPQDVDVGDAVALVVAAGLDVGAGEDREDLVALCGDA
jgi:hypothetical protein